MKTLFNYAAALILIAALLPAFLPHSLVVSFFEIVQQAATQFGLCAGERVYAV